MWSRDRGLGLETVSRPKKGGLGLGLGLECTGLGLGLGLERCGLGLGLGLKGVVLVLGVWSRSFAFDLGLAPLVGTRVDYLLNVVDIFGYSGTSEIASNSCDDPPSLYIGQSERGPRCTLLIRSDKKTSRHSLP